jgi:mRNA-degrading endonuclease RelE of RelBE toxin-antitoxin system
MVIGIARIRIGRVRQLEGYDPRLFRLRTGPWRLIYRNRGEDAIEVVRVGAALEKTALLVSLRPP